MKLSLKNWKRRYLAGFTLVEVLVVIAIIGILTSIAYTSVNQTRAKNRDQKRVADISELQLALEFYFTKHGQYPQVLWDDETLPVLTDLKDFTNKPQPPTSVVENGYFYVPLTSRENGTRCSSYHLWTKLEQNSSALLSKADFNSTALNVCVGGQEDFQVNASSDPLIYDVKR